MTEAQPSSELWPLLIYAILAILIVGGMISISYYLGQRHRERATGETYESGIDITGSARLKFPIQFYMIAMFFVIFDLEVVFLVAWAIAFKEVGWLGYVAALVFIMILIAVFIYEWRIGALDFGPSGKKILKAYKRLNKKLT